MPSYRTVLVVGRLQPGVDAATVLPTAAAAARERTTVEAYDVDVVAGQARVTVRFTADDDPQAHAVAHVTRNAVTALAEVPSATLDRRWGARWSPVRRGPVR